MPRYSKDFKKSYTSEISSRKNENLIALFRGLPLDTHQSSIRKIQSLDNLLQKSFEKYKIDKPRLQTVIMENWKFILGENNAQRCRPEQIDRHKLIICVQNPVVRNNLQFDQRNILSKVRTLSGCEGISTIIFKAG